jgi:hypothetical protein
LGAATPEATHHSLAVAGASSVATPVVRQYDRFILRNANGQALTHTGYVVRRKNGIFEYGETDGDGYTHLLTSVSFAENINVYLAG